MLKAYLAGPDVFRPDWKEHSERLKEACQQFGIEGVFPLDNFLDAFPTDTKSMAAARIRESNMRLIRGCDIVLANVSPFRGPNADDGTAWEVGFATGLGKPVFFYSDDADYPLLNRVYDEECEIDRPTLGKDLNGFQVENFGLTVNLMLVDPTTGGVHRSVERALQYWEDNLKERAT
jgi:nucleoside 2-deoxyribosyltransferase